MPWVSLFEIFPDAIVRDPSERPVPVIEGRVVYEFPDIGGGGGGAGVTVELNNGETSNLRVALTEIVASPVGTDGGYQSYGDLSSDEVTDQYDNVHGMARLEFAEVPDWQYINVETYRPGV